MAASPPTAEPDTTMVGLKQSWQVSLRYFRCCRVLLVPRKYMSVLRKVTGFSRQPWWADPSQLGMNTFVQSQKTGFRVLFADRIETFDMSIVFGYRFELPFSVRDRKQQFSMVDVRFQPWQYPAPSKKRRTFDQLTPAPWSQYSMDSLPSRHIAPVETSCLYWWKVELIQLTVRTSRTAKINLKVLAISKLIISPIMTTTCIYKLTAQQRLNSNMDTSDKLKCFRCGQLPTEFVILGCSHPICVDCYSQIDRSQTRNSTICECDKFSSVRQSTQVTSPQAKVHTYPSTFLNTAEINNEEDYVVGSGYHASSPKKKSHGQVFAKRDGKQVSSFEVHVGKQNRRTRTEEDLEVDSKMGVSGVGELTRELQYAEVQYNKAVEEIKEAFRRQLDRFDKAFDQYREKIKIWYVDMRSIRAKQANINIAKYVKEKFSNIAAQLQSFQTQIFQFRYPTNPKPQSSSLLPNISQEIFKPRPPDESIFKPRSNPKQRKSAPHSQSDLDSYDSLPKNIYIINRPWCVGHTYTPSFISPNKYCSNLRKRNAKNFVQDIIRKNKIRRWIDYKL